MVEGTAFWVPEFSLEEYKQRLALLQAKMKESDTGAVLITTETSYRYFTGHPSTFWYAWWRPILCIVPAHGDPVQLFTPLESGTAKHLSWAQRHTTYHVHDVTSDEVVPAIAAQLRELGCASAKIGCEMSLTPRVGLSPNQLQKLKDSLPEAKFADGADLIWATRLIKSPAEIDAMRTAAHIVNDIFDDVPNWLRPGMTEDQVYREVASRTLINGAERQGYIASYANVAAPIVHWPTQRTYERGNMAFIDAGCLCKGYWSDFNRHIAIGKIDAKAEDAVRAMWDVEQACIEAVKPGNTVADIYVAYEKATSKFKTKSANLLGRIGHGIGLDQLERPSLFPDNEMPLLPGMTMCVEPSFYFDGVGMIIVEETVAVSDTGHAMLSRRGPRGTIQVD